MAPIPPTTESVFNARSILDPAVNEISTLLHRLGIVHDHPDFGDGDIPGDGSPGGGIGDGELIGGPTDAQRSGILMVLMMFGIMAVMFTIVTGWIWCVAAREPEYYTVREGRKGQWKTKKVVPFKEWYRNLPHTKSDLSREEDYLRVLAFISARDWRGCVLPNGEPVDYPHEHWEKFWREHGHKGYTAASGPRSPLMTSERGRAYNTFTKEGRTGLEIPHVEDIEGVLYATTPNSPLAIPVPPLRRPPLKGTRGRSAPSGGSTSPEDEKRKHREQRSHSSGGGSGGRPWKCGRRDPSDLSDGSGRPSLSGSGRGSSKNYRSSRGRVGMGYKGLDVVMEEAPPATEK